MNLSVRLVPNQLFFKASSTLTQFRVINYTMTSQDQDSKISVDVYIRRIYFFQLFNTFIPTFSLLIIAHITLFFDEIKAEFSVGISLTLMLVMYTIYQSALQTIPATAYLKMIDIWLIFNLADIFLVFLVEVT